MPEKCFHLIDSEWTYLKTGEVPGGYRPNDMDARLRKKVELLSTRFKRLFEDIEALSRGPDGTSDLLATETGRKAWAEAMGIDDDPSQDELEQALLFHRGEPGSAPAAFGAKLGEAVNRFMWWPASEDVQREEVVADLVWGFLRGLSYNLRPAGEITADVVREETADLLDMIEERAHAHEETMERPLEDIRARLDHQMMVQRAMADRVREILNEDVPPTTLDLAWGWRSRVDGSDGDGGSQFCALVVAKLIDSAVDTEHPVGSWGQAEAFWEAHGPPDEFDVADFVTAERVHTVIDTCRIRERYGLMVQLEQDAAALASKGSQGAAASDILPKIVEAGPVSSTDLAREIYGSKDYTASVTRLARDLAGIDCDKRAEEIAVWIDRPLLTGGRDGWDATNYGRAANYALRLYEAEQEPHAQSIQFNPIPKSLIDEAMDEIRATD